MAPRALMSIPPVPPGSVIGIAAASSPFPQSDFLRGVRFLETLGYRTRFQKKIWQRSLSSLPYLAGHDAVRAKELTQFFLDPKVRGIVFARGGYGMLRILSRLPWQRIRRHPKFVMGYSDIAPLLLHLSGRYAYPTFSGPMVASDYSQVPSQGFFRKELAFYLEHPDRESWWQDSRIHVLKRGKATGKLLGGCLTMVTSALGTPFEMDTRGVILCLEDHHESLYRIDRMLTQLRLAGKFKGVAGLVFGCLFAGSEKKRFHKLLQDKFHDFSGPIVVEAPFGHCKRPRILPLGRKTTLDTAKGGMLIHGT